MKTLKILSLGMFTLGPKALATTPRKTVVNRPAPPPPSLNDMIKKRPS